MLHFMLFQTFDNIKPEPFGGNHNNIQYMYASWSPILGPGYENVTRTALSQSVQLRLGTCLHRPDSSID